MKMKKQNERYSGINEALLFEVIPERIHCEYFETMSTERRGVFLNFN